MKEKGFSLIELLVVILIISILLAILLPKYENIIEKVYAVKVMSLGKAIKLSAERYYLIHGEYPDSKDQLDIEWKCPKEFVCVFREDKLKKVTFRRTGKYTLIYSFIRREEPYTNKDYCVAPKNNEARNDICKIITGEDDDFLPEDTSWSRYEF
jgi:prepilin-type N-terminal cleavage/methylation domain-containing protein